MIFTAICIVGFLFVCLALPFALRFEAKRRKSLRKITGRESTLLEHSPRRESAWWAKDSTYAHPNTNAEYLDALNRHEQDPHHYPSPFPPQQPGNR
jgi:hypothetical protein